jgi:pilus assembly protein CpaC
MMRMHGLLVVCWVFGITALAQPQSESNISMGIGSQRVLTIPGAIRVAAGSPEVLEVKVVPPNQLLLTALSEGRTTLTVWKNNGQRQVYSVTVRKIDPGVLVTDIKKLLGDIEGIRVHITGDYVYIDGQAYTQADADRIEQVAELYPNSVKNLVKISPNAKRLVAQNLDAAFQKAGLKNIRPNVVGSTIFLEGSVESQQDLEKAQLITKAMGEKVESLLTVGIRRMVLSEVQFVEVRSSTLDRYGIKFPTDLTGGVVAQVTGTKVLVPSAPFAANMTAAGTLTSQWSLGFQNNAGYGRLLAQPKLVCASGETAEFLAGGEIPLPVVTANSIAINYKPYGVMLQIKPTADRSGNIQTEIEAEVSEIDTSVSVSAGGGVSMPGFRKRRVKTNVTVRHGETIVLSGVFNHDEQKSVSKIPGLGHIPIIGELFKNRGFDTDKRELLIFVTPRIVNPESDKIRTMVDDMKMRYKQARSEIRFNIFD